MIIFLSFIPPAISTCVPKRNSAVVSLDKQCVHSGSSSRSQNFLKDLVTGSIERTRSSLSKLDNPSSISSREFFFTKSTGQNQLQVHTWWHRGENGHGRCRRRDVRISICALDGGGSADDGWWGRSDDAGDEEGRRWGAGGQRRIPSWDTVPSFTRLMDKDEAEEPETIDTRPGHISLWVTRRTAFCIDREFRTAWLALVDKGECEEYLAAMLGFVSLCKFAYFMGYTLQSLEMEMALTVKGPVSDSDRAVRATWLYLVFRTLDWINFPRNAVARPPERTTMFVEQDVAMLEELIACIVRAKPTGFQRLKLELSLYGQDAVGRTNRDMRQISQWMRLILYTVGIRTSPS